jgi:hypothetical protein
MADTPSGVAQPLGVFGGSGGCYDEFGFFDPNCGDPFGGIGGGGGGTVVVPAPQVTVNVTNAETIGKEVADTVAGAVKDGVTASAQAASDIAKDTADAVRTGIGGVVDKVVAGVGSALSAIGGVLSDIASWVWNNLTDIFHKIVDNIGTILSDLKDVIVPLIQKVADVVDAVAKQVQQINDTLLQPIADIYNSTIKTVATLTTAIEKDLHDGLGGILKIPTDIANGLSSLDASLQRTVEQLGATNREAINSDWKPMIGATVGAPLGTIGETLKGIQGSGPIKTTFDQVTRLPNECATGPITSWIEGLQNEIAASDSWWAKGLKIILDGLLSLEFVLASLEQKKECYAEEARRNLPTTKLNPGDALEAWRRKFIDADGLKLELSSKGYDGARQSILQAMEVFLADINMAVDWWYRGIIDDADLQDNMEQHGITAADQRAIKAASQNLFPPDLAAEMYLRQLIDADALDRVWQRARMSDQERSGRFNTLLRPPNTAETIRAAHLGALVGGGFNIGTYRGQAPQSYIDTAARERVTPEVANVLWRSQWYVPDVNTMIQLFFRGIRTLKELHSVMDYWGIPPELRDDLIEAHRPLIPFRSIPNMVKKGVLSELDARKALEAHGFPEDVVLRLLKLADDTTSSTTAAQAQQLHGASLQAAKGLYLDGAITQAQYADILAQHNLTPEAVKLEVQFTDLTHAAAERKQTAQDIIDEALAGLLTIEDAQQQLAQANFTIEEQARYLAKLRSSAKKANKTPGEAELFKMLKAGIIDGDLYVSTLEAQGYSEDWANRLLELRIAPQAEPAGATDNSGQ